MAFLLNDEEKRKYYNLRPFLKGNKLTEGSFAKIYKIKIDGIDAAAKVFKDNQTPQTIERVATQFFTLNHENIVKLLRYCTDPSALIFEYYSLDVCGNQVQDLNMLLKYFNENEFFNLGQRINFVHQCSKGLYYLHCHQIVHKDFKPSNILVTGTLTNIQLKITDFDEMVAIKNNILQTYTNYHPKGMTMCYIAPEIINRTTKEVSFKTDVYAWSLTSYEIMNDKCQAWSGTVYPMSDFLLVEALKKGERPDIDYVAKLYKNATKEHPIFQLICQGWDEDPDNRPTSEQICVKIAGIVEQPGSVPNVINYNKEDFSCREHPQNFHQIEEDHKCSPNVTYVMSDSGTPVKGVLYNQISATNDEEDIRMLDEQKAGAIYSDQQYMSISSSKDIDTGELERSMVDVSLNEQISVDVQEKINEVLNSPLKEGKSLHGLYKLLDIGDRMLQICDEFDFSEIRRNEIKLTEGGGGNPSKVFLQDLKMKHGEKISLEAFKNTLEDNNVFWPKFKRTENEDIAVLNVSHLSHYDINDLSLHLSQDNVWKSVAQKLGYKDEDIELIFRYQKRPNNYSGTEILFRIISQEKPKYSVREFMFLLLRLRFKDGYDYMETAINKWARDCLSIN